MVEVQKGSHLGLVFVDAWEVDRIFKRLKKHQVPLEQRVLSEFFNFTN